MTYQLYHGITMVQVDAGDSIFYVDPAFLFFRDGKEIPTSEAINGLKAADVRENFTFGGYTLTMIWVDGAVSFDNFQTLDSIAYHLWFLGAADNATPPPDILPLYAEWYRGYFEYPYGDYNMEISAKVAMEAARAHQEPTEAAPTAQATDDTTPVTQPATEPAEPPLSAEEAAAAAGIFLEPVEGATEILVCCGEFLESTKTPIMTITWRARATDFNLAHILFRAWTMIDEDDPCGYMNACDRVKEYYGKYCPHDDFNRMTLDILQKRYPNGEADIKDEFDERTVASMRKLETKYSKPSVSAILRAKTAVLVKKLAGDVIVCCDRAQELQAAGDSSGSEMELRHADSTGEMMRMEIIGYITVEEWDDINRRAAEANTYHGAQYWRNIANEYIRWADGVPAIQSIGQMSEVVS